jgi:hypothetical protein
LILIVAKHRPCPDGSDSRAAIKIVHDIARGRVALSNKHVWISSAISVFVKVPHGRPSDRSIVVVTISSTGPVITVLVQQVENTHSSSCVARVSSAGVSIGTIRVLFAAIGLWDVFAEPVCAHINGASGVVDTLLRACACSVGALGVANAIDTHGVWSQESTVLIKGTVILRREEESTSVIDANRSLTRDLRTIVTGETAVLDRVLFHTDSRRSDADSLGASITFAWHSQTWVNTRTSGLVANKSVFGTLFVFRTMHHRVTPRSVQFAIAELRSLENDFCFSLALIVFASLGNTRLVLDIVALVIVQTTFKYLFGDHTLSEDWVADSGCASI